MSETRCLCDTEGQGLERDCCPVHGFAVPASREGALKDAVSDAASLTAAANALYDRIKAIAYPNAPPAAPAEPPAQPAGHEWGPVSIAARTPNTANTLLHHAHRGFACTACEILALRAGARAAEPQQAHADLLRRADNIQRGRDCDGTYFEAMTLIRELAAALYAEPVSKAGFVMVPEEPTEEMVDKAFVASDMTKA